MARVDLNCFVGNWPFHYVRNNSLEDLIKLHKANDIEYGYVSALEAIFYHDPYEADSRLAKELEGTAYRHVVTVNPKLPGCCDSVRRMVREFLVAGVRILPGFHDYLLTDPDVEKLCELLEELNLPLFLTLRMEDERAQYMFITNEVPTWDIDGFLGRHRNIKIVICNIRNGEASYLTNLLKYYDNVSIDCSGFKNGLFAIDEFYKSGILDAVVYGSTAPIFCMKSTVLLIETADIPADAKKAVFEGKRFFG